MFYIFMSFDLGNYIYSCPFIGAIIHVLYILFSAANGCYFFIVHICTHTYPDKLCHVLYAVQLLRLVFMGYIVAMETSACV